MIHNIFIAIVSEGYESLKSNPVKRGPDEEDGSVIQPTSLVATPSLLGPGEESVNIKSKKKSEKRSEDAFRAILDEKVSQNKALDSKTARYMNLIESNIKEITKKIEKMSMIIKLDPTDPVNLDKLKEKLEDLLLTDLEDYIDKVQAP